MVQLTLFFRIVEKTIQQNKRKKDMARQRFTLAFCCLALILACVSTAGVNGIKLNSTNFAVTPEIMASKQDRTAGEQTSETERRPAVASPLPSKVLSESPMIPMPLDMAPAVASAVAVASDTISSANLTEARITSITFRSEDKETSNLFDKDNDETISFGIRSFTVEIATPPTEKPIPLNERVGAADTINVQQAAAILPILTEQNGNDGDDTLAHHRPIVLDEDAILSPEMVMAHAKNKHDEFMASRRASSSMESAAASDVNGKINTSSPPSPAATNSPAKAHSNNSNGEQKLENGLYRNFVKIAEIITDEFSNGNRDGDGDAKQILDEHSLIAGTNSNGQQYNKIADLYPSKLEDFSSIIRESNEKLIQEKNRYVGLDKSNVVDDGNEQENAIRFGNSMGDENALDTGDANINDNGDKQHRINKLDGAFNSIENNIPTTKIEIELIDEPGASKDDEKVIGPGRDDDDYVSVTDFTSELQLKDDMVSKIEQSFRESSMVNIPQPIQQQEPQPQQQQHPITINHPVNPLGFIERRVKKFDPTFKKRMSLQTSDTNTNPNGGDSMANTKSIDENIISHSDEERKFDAAGIQRKENEKHIDAPIKQQSSTSINNASSKSQSMDKDNHNKVDDLVQVTESSGSSRISNERIGVGHGINSAKKNVILSPVEQQQQPGNATERKILFFNVNNNGNANGNGTIDQLELERLQKHREQIIKESRRNDAKSIAASNHTNGGRMVGLPANMHLHIMHDDTFGQKPSESIKTNYGNANKVSSPVAITVTAGAETVSMPSTTATERSVVTPLNRTTSNAVQQQQQPPSVPLALIDTISSTESNSIKHSSQTQNSIKLPITQSPISTTTTTAAPAPATSTATPATLLSTKSRNINSNFSKQPQQKQKPFGRRGFDGFYFDTECDMQTPIPSDSTIWRGNETHELNLPTTTPENCSGGGDCMPMIISWEGAAEIQSGDVLIVEIDDTLLLPADMNPSTIKSIDTINGHRIATAVYQVTRPGHEHCDATEGILLDITPLVVDGKKLVTLYDKDLTEGDNLLIVVSDLWGPQCVRLKVTVKSDNCGENAQCNGKGICFSNASMEGYECQCCTGFAGSHCEEIDACSPSPCTNNGICVDLSQGHDGNSYQCLCPYGYTGKNCQFESDPCQNGECQNGGTCTGNATHFRCDCAPGFTGPLCQHNLNECESSPCVHGICVDQEDGFRCFCQPGFSGELCNYEYNECDSNPCLNDGQCTDHIGGFSCKCTRGYTGKRCHMKVDFCANNPCPEGHQCMDHGNDFSCECPEGRSGLDCNQTPRTRCNINPCANGGTCWTSDESFYCACRAGFTGKMCEDEFILDTVVNTNDIVTDTSDASDTVAHTRPFGESSYSAIMSRGTTIGMHNAYIAMGTFASAIFIVAIVIIVFHCRFQKSYRRFTTRQHQLIPIFGFSRRAKQQSNNARHWLSGKGHLTSSTASATSASNKLASTTVLNQSNTGGNGGGNNLAATNAGNYHHPTPLIQQVPQFQRHLAMNLENDMYYTVDFGDSQHSPLIH